MGEKKSKYEKSKRHRFVNNPHTQRQDCSTLAAIYVSNKAVLRLTFSKNLLDGRVGDGKAGIKGLPPVFLAVTSLIISSKSLALSLCHKMACFVKGHGCPNILPPRVLKSSIQSSAVIRNRDSIMLMRLAFISRIRI